MYEHEKDLAWRSSAPSGPLDSPVPFRAVSHERDPAMILSPRNNNVPHESNEYPVSREKERKKEEEEKESEREKGRGREYARINKA